jgi:hypothetical protein
MEQRNDLLSLESLEDLRLVAEIVGHEALERRPEVLDDDDTRWRLEQVIERGKAHERAQGRPFLRRIVNARLGRSEHRTLMHQQW